jgi:putative addiction module antidote
MLEANLQERYTFCITGIQPMNKPLRDAETEEAVLRIKKIGNSVGLILPKELLARLKLKVGDQLHIVEQTERGLKLTPYDPKHTKAMKIAREVMDEYQDTFRALAK